MNTKEADIIGAQISSNLTAGNAGAAHRLVDPILRSRTPFRLLDRIGAQIGKLPADVVQPLLQDVSRGGTIGGWPLIGAALAEQLAVDMPGTLARCREFIAEADVWHATDSFGERVIGRALLADLRVSLRILASWRSDANRWVRRSLGVAIHLWAKRAHGAEEFRPQAIRLLTFLRPMFAERDIDAAKGVGWALKTMGRYYPAELADWMVEQVGRSSAYRAILLRKAVKFLPPGERNRVRMASFR